VNGEDLGWFLFDSGAGINCISNEVVKGLEGPFGEIGARGVGGPCRPDSGVPRSSASGR
jgi:hypothetical protein